MGVWGMGLTQSDEFCEVYDSFMNRYNNGADVVEIVADILLKYHNEFDDNDGVLHDQWTFHSDKALSYLKFMEAKKIQSGG